MAKRAKGSAREVPGERLLALEHSISRTLAETPDAPDALKAAIRAICESEGWHCGRYVRLDGEAGVLRDSEAWCIADPALERYLEASREMRYTRGFGVVGTVWQTGQPLWVPDITKDSRIVRPGIVRETGLKGTLAVPVATEGRFRGVLVLLCRQSREVDLSLLQSMRVIGRQMALLVERAQAEEDTRRFRLAMDASADMIALIDRSSMRYVDVNQTICRLLGYSRDELLALGPADLVPGLPRAELERTYDRLIADPSSSSAVRAGYRCKDGSLLPIESRRRVHRSGERWLIVAISTDIRERLAAETALRESESRFRKLIELSSDWYWEQDAELRFVATDGVTEARGGITPEDHIGKRRWELPNTEIVSQTWAEHRAVLDARQPFRDLILRRFDERNDPHYVSVAGEPMLDAAGGFRGYRGLASDVTDRIRDERLLRLEHQVSRALSEADTESAGLQAVMRAVCESQGFASGRYFRMDDAAGLLRFQEGWASDDPVFRRFVEESRGVTFKPGAGLAGIVLQNGEPVWSTDTGSDPRVQAKKLSVTAGTHGAFAFAVVSEGRRIGVLSFSSQTLRPPDRRLLDGARVIGAQVGQFLERKRAEGALRESEARFRSLTQMSSDFFWEMDTANRFTQLVHGPKVASQFSAGVLGKCAWDLPSTTPDEAGWAALRATIEAHQPFRDFEFGRPRSGGGARHFSVSGEPRFGTDGTFLGYRGVGRDITDVVAAREHVASLAYHDALTGLSNRTSLGPALEQAVERARRRNARLAAMFVDLDGFKQVNDALGHEAGDRFLVEVARRLRAALRASDLVARLGGDEFFVVLEDQQESEAVETVARKLLAEIQRPVELAPGVNATVSASIGISAFPDDAPDAATLIKHADAAMYRAKQAGKNAYRFFGEADPRLRGDDVVPAKAGT